MTILTHPGPTQAASGDLVLAVQPILDEEQTRKAFEPLCNYLAQAAGTHCHILTSPNFYAYWELIRRGTGYDLAFDAAHFTDYRVTRHQFEVLAKIPDSVTYTLVTHADNFVTEPVELTGKRVATLGTPSIGAAQLNVLFPNPARQPIVTEITNAEAGLQMVAEKRVGAAILPTPIVSQHMARGERFLVVMTTDPIPHIALSAAPSLPSSARAKLRDALVQANQSAEGRKMLGAIGFPRFEAANGAIYSGQARVLQQYWGF